MSDNGNIWADKFIKREQIPAGELAQRFNINNPRLHPEAQRAATESSLDTVGWIDEVSLSTNGEGPPSLADNPDAVMFDGHERVEIALVRGGPDTLVPVNWYQLTPEETDFALLAKDQTSAMAQIDPVKMADLMERTKAMTTAPGLRGMMERLKEQVADGLLAQNGNGAGSDTAPQIDKAAELQEKWQVQPGQLWQLGEHRIVCGDCTDAAVVERVMGEDRAEITISDPPYNVGIKYSEQVDDKKQLDDYKAFCISWFELCKSVSDRQIITPGRRNIENWCRWFQSKTIGTWTKDNAINRGKTSLFACWEPVFFFGEQWKRIRANDIFNYPVSNQQGVGNHPCPKPLPMWEDLIINYSDPEVIVFDPFLGSGTTLIACQNLGRRCRGVEIEPKYVAVTLQRFLDHTGIQPRLLETVEA